jgi:hypothetical protein
MTMIATTIRAPSRISIPSWMTGDDGEGKGEGEDGRKQKADSSELLMGT